MSLPNSQIRNDIDRSIYNGVSTEDFHNSLLRIVEDILHLSSDSEMVCTSSYLSYCISSELMRSSNQNQQHDYAEIVSQVLNIAYNDTGVSQRLSNMALVDGLAVFANFYAFHSRLLTNGRVPTRPYTNPAVPLILLRNIVQSSYGPWNGYLSIIGGRPSDPRIRLVEQNGFWISRNNENEIANGAWTIRVGRRELSNVPTNSTNQVSCSTWNMQGGSAGTEDKWRRSVLSLARRSDIVCLQEFGQPPNSAEVIRELYVEDQFGQRYTMFEYQWRAGTTTRPENYRVYFFNVDRIRVNLAFVIGDDNVFNVRNAVVVADGLGPTPPRPAIGLRIAGPYDDGRTDFTIFCFHAISGGGPNCPRMIREITRHVLTPFAVLGDFNRDPRIAQWISPPEIAEIVPADSDTHGAGPSAAMLDYAVTNGTTSASDPGRVEETPMPSDHKAVFMNFNFLK